jgi:effector-binding domain-containing protein
MPFETVEVQSRPMLYVTRSAGMQPEEISAVMGEAFGAIGAFIGRSGVVPAGPPIAVYRDWDGGKMAIDVGFPVGEADAARAAGEVRSGRTPSGKALKAVHRGPYRTLRDTYGEMEAEMKKSGIAMPQVAWEVYVSDPDKTPEGDLLTEIYMPVG